jgi:hypothetical protein
MLEMGPNQANHCLWCCRWDQKILFLGKETGLKTPSELPSLLFERCSANTSLAGRRQNETNSFTFISTSGVGSSLARGKSNRTDVMIRAPRNTKMTENLGQRDKVVKALFTVSFNQLGLAWLFPRVNILYFNP